MACQETLMSAYRDLGNAGVTTRRAAALAGVSRAGNYHYLAHLQ